MDHNSLSQELNVDNSKENIEFINLIKKEYFTMLFRVFSIIMIIFLISVIYYMLSYQLFISNLSLIFDLIVSWLIFIVYLLIHFSQITISRFSPTLINYVNEELKHLDFEINRKHKIGLKFFMFNSFTLFLFILVNLGINISNDYYITSLIIRLIIIYIFLSLAIPILRGVFHDYLLLKLKRPYSVQIDFQFKLIKHVEAESQMVRIYMKSNELGLKSDENKFNIYKRISEKRWLLKKTKRDFPFFLFRPKFRFYESSSPKNFNEHLLNIIAAIREWDIMIKNEFH
ncbi:MAG: hypothetical protein ACFFCV_10440 [Promethearchaeota archaeon]